jgi:hypothetical protein
MQHITGSEVDTAETEERAGKKGGLPPRTKSLKGGGLLCVHYWGWGWGGEKYDKLSPS